MEHARVRELLAVSAREWSGVERHQVETHLRACHDCAAIAHEYATHEQLLAILPRIDMSYERQQAILDRIHRGASPIQRSKVAVRAMGAAAGLLGIGLVVAVLIFSRRDVLLTSNAAPDSTSTQAGSLTTATIESAHNVDPPKSGDIISDAITINLGVKYANLEFSAGVDPFATEFAFYKMRVTSGVLVTCETLDLAPHVDTTLLLLDNSLKGVAISDDRDRANGDLGSRVTHYVTKAGYLYLQVSGRRVMVNPKQANDAFTYSLRCFTDGLPTPTP